MWNDPPTSPPQGIKNLWTLIGSGYAGFLDSRQKYGLQKEVTFVGEGKDIKVKMFNLWTVFSVWMFPNLPGGTCWNRSSNYGIGLPWAEEELSVCLQPGDLGWILESGRAPGGKPATLQVLHTENPMEGGASGCSSHRTRSCTWQRRETSIYEERSQRTAGYENELFCEKLLQKHIASTSFQAHHMTILISAEIMSLETHKPLDFADRLFMPSVSPFNPIPFNTGIMKTNDVFSAKCFRSH